jgi:hypothetical protein
MNKPPSRHVLASIATSLLLASGSFAQPTPAPTLTVRGAGVADAEEAAAKAALVKAVSGVIDIVVEATARKKHQATIDEKVLAKAADFVKSHEVLKTEKLGSGKISVQVRAEVDRAAVVAKLTEVGVIAKEDAAAAELAKKMVQFCKDNFGKTVGDGECGTLAVKAVDAAGAKPFFEYKENPGLQDFVWGELVFVLEIKDGKRKREPADGKAKPGDVIQYRDATFRSGGGIYVFSHHTAVVADVKATGELVVYEQNMQGKREVTKGTLRPGDLAGGWIRVYRPVAK